MTHHGYDPQSKNLFSWDGDFKYLGKIDKPPENSFIVSEKGKRLCELIGCMFLSGCRKERIVLSLNKIGEEVFGLMGSIFGRRITFNTTTVEGMGKINGRENMMVCLCGGIVKHPQDMSEFCRMLPCSSVYACSVVEELAAFGVLVCGLAGKEKPRRLNFCVPNTELLGTECQEFDMKLEGDNFGRMADVIRQGIPVLNEIMTCMGISPFYGKVLVKEFAGLSTFIIRSDAVDRYFPYEPISAKSYAATSVFVEMKNTPIFSEHSGCNAKKVNIMVASDYVSGLQVFMTFYKIMSGFSFVGVAELKDFPKSIPVFRYNKGYKGRD
jgi:hypothetical protein